MQSKLCASKEDSTLGRPDEEAAGCVWDSLSGLASSSTRPTHWLASLGVQNNLMPVQISGLLSSEQLHTTWRKDRRAPGHWLLFHLWTWTPDVIAWCSQAANSLFILSLPLSPETAGITMTTNS